MSPASPDMIKVLNRLKKNRWTNLACWKPIDTLKLLEQTNSAKKKDTYASHKNPCFSTLTVSNLRKKLEQFLFNGIKRTKYLWIN
jgi:hypothetical protein